MFFQSFFFGNALQVPSKNREELDDHMGIEHGKKESRKLKRRGVNCKKGKLQQKKLRKQRWKKESQSESKIGQTSRGSKAEDCTHQQVIFVALSKDVVVGTPRKGDISKSSQELWRQDNKYVTEGGQNYNYDMCFWHAEGISLPNANVDLEDSVQVCAVIDALDEET